MLIKTANDTLTEAGRTLAQLGDPDKDLLNFATDAREIAFSIKNVAAGLDYAYEIVDGPLDEVHALTTAKRTLQLGLVALAQLVGELEMKAALIERLRFARGES
jgi:hypothetical protein